MLTVTESAQNQIADFFKDKELKPVRVFLADACSGPRVALAVDDNKAGDVVFEVAGIQYLIDKEFLAAAQPIKIDFLDQGFKIDIALELCGCGGCGSPGGCCH